VRLRKIYAKLAKENLEGLLVSSPANISYLTDYTSRDSYLLISKKKNIYITDSRYTEEAKRKIKGPISIIQVKDCIFKTTCSACRGLSLKRIGFEEKYISYPGYQKLKEGLSDRVNLIPTSGLVEELRQIKTEEELKKIRKATQVTISAFKFIKDFIVCGRRELEIAAELERFIMYAGARSSAFDIIVASGPNSSFPHHLTSERRIKNNEPVLIDMGVDYLGYKSDLTRVFFLGKINPTLKRIYDIAIEAQNKAIRKLKPDARIDKIDALARQHITKKGYGGFFGHNLGHGIGLEVHEKPGISSKEKSTLRPGMVFTVEPGIYLPGKFGVRIEDIVLITKEGCEVISGSLNK